MIKLHLVPAPSDISGEIDDSDRWCRDDQCHDPHVLQMSDFEYQEAITAAYQRGWNESSWERGDSLT